MISIRQPLLPTPPRKCLLFYEQVRKEIEEFEKTHKSKKVIEFEN